METDGKSLVIQLAEFLGTTLPCRSNYAEAKHVLIGGFNASTQTTSQPSFATHQQWVPRFQDCCWD
jgi:hypothetical protein